MSSSKFITLLFLLLVFSGCDSFIDDQTLISEEQDKIVNPGPSNRNFIENNSQHKVIVAILDSGIDYNHPYLKNNIHFTLDEAGRPISAGWDYAGNDSWPAPYVARTDFKNPLLSPLIRDGSHKEYIAFQKLIEIFPELSDVMNPERQHQEEAEEMVSHGTHVAGLASYDSPEIGLRGYRVLPFNRTDSDDHNKTFEIFTKVLLEGIQQAIQDGAKVLNMSLGVLSNQAKKDDFKKFQDDLILIAEKNPDVFFVVAAGNEGERLDGEKSLSLPCYIPRKNVICVSALDKNLDPADFSNILTKNDVTTIYAWGDEILSTVPTNLCSYDEMDTSLILKDIHAFGKLMKKKCENPPLFQKMSGTSMASPIVARKIAKLIAQNPDLNTQEIKSLLFDQTIPGTFGELSISKLPIEKPSWYKLKGLKISPKSLMRKSLMTN